MRFYRQSAVSKRTLNDILSKNKEYSEDEKKEIITEIFEIDPDKKGHKNSVWLAKQYLITDGDLPDNITKLLEVFNTLCDRNRIKDKELKNYKNIEDLQNVVKKESEKGMSRKDELEKRSIEGLKEIDRLGEFVLYHATDYDVWKDRINKKMKEGYKCGWCIKDPEYWNEYSKDDYLYVEKGEKPWIVADNNSGQCKDYNDDANPENIMQCAYLLYKNGMDFSDDFKITYLYGDENTPEKIKNKILEKALEDSSDAYELLANEIITKEDGEIYNKVLEKAIENSGNAYLLLDDKTINKEDGEIFKKAVEKAIEDSNYVCRLLYDKIITKSDGEIYNKVLEKALENLDNANCLLSYKVITKEEGEIYNKLLEKAMENSRKAYNLLHNKVITKENGEIYNKAVEKAIEDSEKACELLWDEIIKKEDGGIYNKAVEKALENSEKAFTLIYNERITKEDGEIFYKAVEKALETSWRACHLLLAEIITKSDGEIFNKAVERAIEDSENAYKLLSNKIITKSDVSSGLWEKILLSAEKDNPDARQKYGSMNFRRSNMRFYRISGKNNFRRKAEKEENSDIRIYLTNLGKYNEGELVGEWVTLPVDDNFKSVLERIGISDKPDKNGIVYEEYFITDYEAPFEIGEYDNIYELNELAEKLDDFDSLEKKVFFYCKDNGYDDDKAFEIVLDHSYSLYEASSPTDLAYEVIEEMGGIDALAKNTLENYFDYTKFGKDLSYDGFRKLDYEYYIQLEE